MTLNGYYFAATGITEYALFHGDRDILSVSHDCLPDAPVRIRAASGAVFTFARGDSWDGSMPSPGASFPFLGPDGAEAGRLYLLSADHFAVAIPGAALNGRIIHERLHRSVCLTGLDDALAARLEYDFDRLLSRERFGEWFPRRYVAEHVGPGNETLLSLALAAPFLGYEGLEVR